MKRWCSPGNICRGTTERWHLIDGLRAEPQIRATRPGLTSASSAFICRYAFVFSPTARVPRATQSALITPSPSPAVVCLCISDVLFMVKWMLLCLNHPRSPPLSLPTSCYSNKWFLLFLFCQYIQISWCRIWMKQKSLTWISEYNLIVNIFTEVQ